MADDQVEILCERMAELRHALTGDIRNVSRSARVMSDWTFYVRRFPWATVAVAGLAGFLLVPRKKAIISPNQDALAELVRKKHLRLNVDHKQEKPGILKNLAAIGATWAMKTGMGYLGERVRIAALHKSHESAHAASHDSVHHDSVQPASTASAVHSTLTH